MFEKTAKRIICTKPVKRYFKKKVSKDRKLLTELGAIYPDEKANQILENYLIRKISRLILLVSFILIIVSTAVLANRGAAVLKGTSLLRREAGEGDYNAALIARIEGKDYPISVNVNEIYLGEEDIDALFALAKEEVDEVMPGENESLGHVTKNLVFPDTLQEGMVSAEWSVSDYRIIDSNGRIKEEALSEEGTVVKITAKLTYRDESLQYEQYVSVYSPEKDEEERVEDLLEEAILTADEETADDENFILPDKADEYEIDWKEEAKNTAPSVFLVGILFIALFLYHDRSRVRDEYLKRQEQLLIDYPGFVSKLSLLLEAGMTIGKAWEKIALEYRDNRSKKRYVYEEMLIIYYRMQEGLGEREAYELFGKRCALREYLKLSSVITQNLKKGSEGLGELLEAEVRDAFESRKSLAKQRGEEAGTRLLAPMMMLMIIVMAIVMIPGIITFSA